MFSPVFCSSLLLTFVPISSRRLRKDYVFVATQNRIFQRIYLRSVLANSGASYVGGDAAGLNVPIGMFS